MTNRTLFICGNCNGHHNKERRIIGQHKTLTRLAKRTRISAVITYQCLTDVSHIIIEKSTKVIITMNNVKIIVTCDFSSDGLHFILYFHSWFMWRYNKTTVGNLSKENCSLTDVSQHTPYSLVIICAFEIKTILNGFMFLSYYAMFFFESAHKLKHIQTTICVYAVSESSIHWTIFLTKVSKKYKGDHYDE
jgi:hypothetical protein